jgi:hypothetical protein
MYDIFITMDQIQITEYLANKVFNGELTSSGDYIMLKNKQIYSVLDYGELMESYKLSPEDAFVYINLRNYSDVELYKILVEYLFPLVAPSIYDIVDSYLDKLGFYATDYPVYPATGLKYYAVVRLSSDRLVIEIVDIDTVATNTGLRKIVANMLGKDILTKKEISWDQIFKIHSKLEKQKLFAGYDSDEVYKIIYRYYMNHDTSLAKEVLAITNAYNQIFEPYRVVYDTTTRRQVLM